MQLHPAQVGLQRVDRSNDREESGRCRPLRGVAADNWPSSTEGQTVVTTPIVVFAGGESRAGQRCAAAQPRSFAGNLWFLASYPSKEPIFQDSGLNPN